MNVMEGPKRPTLTSQSDAWLGIKGGRLRLAYARECWFERARSTFIPLDSSPPPPPSIQEAVDATGMTEVPVEDRTRLLSDNGPGYVSRAFQDYLHLVGIRHILAAPFHPETNGKLERYHRTIKQEVNQVPYEQPSQLERALADFVDYYNFRRYHKALGDVAPADVLYGRREQILQRRKEVKAQTIQNRSHYNQTLRKLKHPS